MNGSDWITSRISITFDSNFSPFDIIMILAETREHPDRNNNDNDNHFVNVHYLYHTTDPSRSPPVSRSNLIYIYIYTNAHMKLTHGQPRFSLWKILSQYSWNPYLILCSLKLTIYTSHMLCSLHLSILASGNVHPAVNLMIAWSPWIEFSRT